MSNPDSPTTPIGRQTIQSAGSDRRDGRITEPSVPCACNGVARSCRQEVLWFASGDYKKVVLHGSASTGARLSRETPRQLYGSSAPVKVVRNKDERCAPVLSFGSTVDIAHRVRDVAIRNSRRELWPGVDSDLGTATVLPTSWSTQSHHGCDLASPRHTRCAPDDFQPSLPKRPQRAATAVERSFRTRRAASQTTPRPGAARTSTFLSVRKFRSRIRRGICALFQPFVDFSRELF